ncbi:MAG: SWIM zinc finger family protein [Dactylosporangium sp.]|nr:SWIM zinc finger family protein [Dactylosporangium sp.]NNJ59476.1 SWIM zinc finger family protein [Dactylosporangium sp.]
MSRADLLALTPDSLAALANRGLVKRATREVEADAGPTVTVGADGAVHGEYPDGTRTVLAPGAGLETATCGCPATGLCRHVIALVLAYQRRERSAPASAPRSGSTPGPAAVESPPAAGPVVDWSPGEFSDEDLETLVGARALTAARRALRAGCTARVRRASAADPVPSVELTACVVRFLVPHELGYVHTDATAGARDRVVPLAVWAFRAADERAPGVEEILLDVGGETTTAAGDSGLGPALALTEDILLDGVVHTGPTLAATVERVRRDLDAAGLRWPLLALETLDDQLSAYRERAARYRPERAADLIAELHARHRAVTTTTGHDASPRSRVLGTREAASTPLRRLRLTGLGCRVTASAPGRGDDQDPPESVAEVYLAHPDTGAVLVLRRGWKSGADDGLTGSDLGRKRASGLRVDLLASGDVVSESAVRSASRMVRFSASRVARSAATPFSDSWGALPETLLVRDLAEAARAMAALPPRLVRPRIEAEFVRAVRIGKVRAVGYHPGDQRLEAIVEDEAGTCATVAATYRSVCPGALDALAGALSGDRGQPRYLSGTLRRTQGGLVIDPLAVVADATMTVIDLAQGEGTGALQAAVAENWSGPVEEAVAGARLLLADAAHQGLRHLPPTFANRLTATERALTRVGLARAGGCVAQLTAALGTDSDSAVVAAWIDAQIRLSVTDECL